MKCTKCGNETGRQECDEKPELLLGAPIGMYHCPDCGEMVLAGFPHPYLCKVCNENLGV